MRIDDSINLVLPLRENDEYVEIYAYHSPISKEVFEANYRAFAAVKAELASKGTTYQMLSGPQIASLVLKEEIAKISPMDDVGGEKWIKSIFAELARLTTIVIATANGFDRIPVDVAIKKDLIDSEEWDEVASGIIFFTSHYWMTKRANRKELSNAVASLLSGFVTSSPVSDSSVFSQTLTTTENTEPKAVSSVPV